MSKIFNKSDTSSILMLKSNEGCVAAIGRTMSIIYLVESMTKYTNITSYEASVVKIKFRHNSAFTFIHNLS